MTYYVGFPPVPHPPRLFNIDHLAIATSQVHISAPEQTRAQNRGRSLASMETTKPTHKICDRDRCVIPEEGVGCSKENVFLSHGDPKPAEWRNRVVDEWYTSQSRRSRSRQCRYADMLYQHDMPPCPVGWGKIFYERLCSHGRQSMENDDPKAILEEYRQRHMQEERPKGPRLRMVPQVNPESHMWELDPEESPSQPAPSGYHRYPGYSGPSGTHGMSRKGKQKTMVHDGEQNETVDDGEQKNTVMFSECGFCGDCYDCRWGINSPT